MTNNISMRTTLLISGYIRSNCKNITFGNIRLDHSSILPNLQQICEEYYDDKYDVYFCPEKFVKYNGNTIKEISMNSLLDRETLGTTFERELNNCISGDIIHLYPGEYIFEDIKFDRSTIKSVHIIGIGQGVILKGRMKITSASNIYFDNVIFDTRNVEISDEDEGYPKAIQIGEWMDYKRRKINIFFRECTFQYEEEWCISVEEDCGVYLKYCTFEGFEKAGSAISARPFYLDLHVIGCTFKGCAHSMRPYLNRSLDGFVTDLRSCVEISAPHDSLSKKVNRRIWVDGSVILIGNKFIKTGGRLVALQSVRRRNIDFFLTDNETDDKQEPNIVYKRY